MLKKPVLIKCYHHKKWHNHALGCGIGKEDYDPEKVRYHNIIIMADADGWLSYSNITVDIFIVKCRAIEKGFIYIAQPPLYRVQKELKQYLKDDEAL